MTFNINEQPPSPESIWSESRELQSRIDLDRRRLRHRASVLLAVTLVGAISVFLLLSPAPALVLMLLSLIGAYVGALFGWSNPKIRARGEQPDLPSIGVAAIVFFVVSGALVALMVHPLVTPEDSSHPNMMVPLIAFMVALIGTWTSLLWVGKRFAKQLDWIDRLSDLEAPDDTHCLCVEQWLEEPLVRQYVTAVAKTGRQLVKFEFEGLKAHIDLQKSLTEREDAERACRNVYMHPLVGSDSAPIGS